VIEETFYDSRLIYAELHGLFPNWTPNYWIEKLIDSWFLRSLQMICVILLLPLLLLLLVLYNNFYRCINCNLFMCHCNFLYVRVGVIFPLSLFYVWLCWFCSWPMGFYLALYEGWLISKVSNCIK